MLRPEYPIGTARLVLRPFAPDDLDDLHAYQARPDVVRYLYWELPDRAQAGEALDQKIRQATIEEPGESLVLAVVWPEVGRASSASSFIPITRAGVWPPRPRG